MRAAFRTGDLDLSLSSRNSDLLTALRTYVITIHLAIIPFPLQETERIHHPIAIDHVIAILQSPLVDVPGQESEQAVSDEDQSQKMQKRTPEKQIQDQ